MKCQSVVNRLMVSPESISPSASERHTAAVAGVAEEVEVEAEGEWKREASCSTRRRAESSEWRSVRLASATRSGSSDSSSDSSRRPSRSVQSRRHCTCGGHQQIT